MSNAAKRFNGDTENTVRLNQKPDIQDGDYKTRASASQLVDLMAMKIQQPGL